VQTLPISDFTGFRLRRDQHLGYEESSEIPVFAPGSRDLHNEFRGRQAELREDG
jgi:hypothetical protein